MNEVRHVRLINGEELVTMIAEPGPGDNLDEFMFQDPYVIQEKLLEDGSEIMTLARYIPYTEEKVAISKCKVMTITPVLDAFARYYEVSRVYNKTFLEKHAEVELERITRMMENLLDSHSGKNVKRANGEVIFVHPGFLQTSNSQH